MADQPLPLDDLVAFSISLTPRSDDTWHLSIVVRSYWTLRELANRDYRCDTLAVAQDAIDGTLRQYQADGAQSDPERSGAPT